MMNFHRSASGKLSRELVSVQFECDEHRLTLMPVPIPFIGSSVGHFEASTRLSMQLKLVDARGSHVWTRKYDDGSRRGVWDYPVNPAWLAGIKLATQEAAWRLSQQA